MLDDAVLYFTKRFYQIYLEGETVCEAFNQAVASVKFKEEKREGEMFVLLTQEMLQHDIEQLIISNTLLSAKESQHVCQSRINVQEGTLQCISDHILIKQIPQKVPNLEHREKPIAKLVQNVMDGERLVILLGLHGMHKSAVARNAIHFMLERKYFTGGAIFVSLKDVKYFR